MRTTPVLLILSAASVFCCCSSGGEKSSADAGKDASDAKMDAASDADSDSDSDSDADSDSDSDSDSDNSDAGCRDTLFMARYDKNGDYMWKFDLSSEKAAHRGYASALIAGNLYITAGDYNEREFFLRFNSDTGEWKGVYMSGTSEDKGRYLDVASPDTVNFILAGYSGDEILIYKRDINLFEEQWKPEIRGDGYASNVNILNDKIRFAGGFDDLLLLENGGSPETELWSQGDLDIFVIEYDSEGRVSWSETAGGRFEDGCTAMTADNSGNAVITGFITQAVSNETTDAGMDSGADSGGKAGSPDVFIAKYTSSGTPSWQKTAGGDGNDRGSGVVAPPDDSIVVTGVFEGSAVFGKGEGAETVLDSAGGTDVFIARFSASDGSLQWAVSAGGSHDDAAAGIALLPGDIILIAGNFTQSADFGSGPEKIELQGDSHSSVFLATYDSEGSIVWAKKADLDRLDNSAGKHAENVIHESDGEFIITGWFSHCP